MQYTDLLIQVLLATGLASVSSLVIFAKDITVDPAVPAANILSVYQGLDYTNFAVNQVQAGFKSNTPPNVIVTGAEQTTVNGALAMIETTGRTKSFDLRSFFHSCTANTLAGADAVAQECAFVVRGYRSTGDAGPVATDFFTFEPAARDRSPAPAQVLARLSAGFNNLQKVNFLMREPASGEMPSDLNLDSVTYLLNF